MLRRILTAIVWSIGGYLLGAIGGFFLVSTLSSNVHDASQEAVMTGAFVSGPLVGLIGFIVGLIRGGKPG